MVCGAPKIYGQLVQMLTPYSRVIKDAEAPQDGVGAGAATSAHVEVQDATAAFVDAHLAPAAPVKKAPLRIRKTDNA